jgi:uncharacterized repeat protein (TIGR04052 family)
MNFISRYLSLVAVSLTFAGTTLWSFASSAQTPQNVTIRFSAKVGKQPFSCGQNYRLGQPASSVTPADYRFYVSNVALLDTNGKAVPITLKSDGKWQLPNVALLDFENKTGACANGTSETNTQIVGTIPPGTYRGLQLTLGVPARLNHADATLAASPLNLTSLWWNWQGGYKFMRVDLQPQNPVKMKSKQTDPHGAGHNSPQSGFPIHLGSTGCLAPTANSAPGGCTEPNLATVTFPNFDLNRHTIVADLAALTANTNLSMNHPNTPPGCMSAPTDKDCAGIMTVLGLPFKGTPVRSQTFLTVD